MSGILQKVENIIRYETAKHPLLKPLPIEWNKGVLKSELIAHSIFAGEHDELKEDSDKPNFTTGTYVGTKKAVSEVYTLINKTFTSFFDVHQFESHLPTAPISLAEKKERFQFQIPGSDGYPPHLSLEPKTDFLHSLKIFQADRLFATAPIVQKVIPEKFLDFLYDEPNQRSFALIESVNRKLFDERRDIGKMANIGTRKDWYSDEVYAQQQFTGVNPVTIKKASKEWIQQFKAAGSAQGKTEALKVIEEAERDEGLYVQDCSYFRKFAGVEQEEPLKSDDGKRFGCASVSLFHLLPSGALHPLAIILDYTTNITTSLTLFNRLSDWHAHELGVHLTHTHLIEEGIIIASHRNLPEDHPVFKLLSPHWLKTLPLNAAARASLIPQVIVHINGLTKEGSLRMVRKQYETFDFVGNYIPNDLESRGFPLKDLNSKRFHNYAYAKKHASYVASAPPFRLRYAPSPPTLRFLRLHGPPPPRLGRRNPFQHWSQHSLLSPPRLLPRTGRRYHNVHPHCLDPTHRGKLPARLLPSLRPQQTLSPLLASPLFSPAAPLLHRNRSHPLASSPRSEVLAPSFPSPVSA
ncbi:hypothetical protein DID88_009981 [Monilinia fructigena]|uniref:Manganese lipoxygenase n=1 Tax=Monilinia fructigena TaxID=38457 RepID=A0A395IMQ5_9HELO|nr:hypothetical protein DID88_009981 [Monilinia fructigena]